ncbi:MAG: DoxX family protein [Acidobacteria bacterium]|nr:DoxX family protein [Acidobacteriota bacterium]
MNIEDIGRNLPALVTALFVSVLFVQSGLDKFFDWRGNLEWLNGHFSKTFLAPLVPVLLATITAMELSAGLLAAVGVVYLLFTSSTLIIFWSTVLAALALLALFFGQRIAKDYPGAAVIVPYFILVGLLMYVTNPFARP